MISSSTKCVFVSTNAEQDRSFCSTTTTTMTMWSTMYYIKCIQIRNNRISLCAYIKGKYISSNHHTKSGKCVLINYSQLLHHLN